MWNGGSEGGKPVRREVDRDRQQGLSWQERKTSEGKAERRREITVPAVKRMRDFKYQKFQFKYVRKTHTGPTKYSSFCFERTVFSSCREQGS